MSAIVAFIVAVEEYAQRGWTLPGARQKALDVARCLLGMGVKPNDISLFVRLNLEDQELKAGIENAGVRVFSPTLDELDTQFNLLSEGRQRDSRLFFYWYGHGYADMKRNRLLLCEDFDLKNFYNRVFNATNRLLRLRTSRFNCFSEQVFLADVCGQQSRGILGLDEVPIDEARLNSRQLAVFATREGEYSDGTFSEQAIKLLKTETAWIAPDALLEKLMQALQTASIEPYVVDAYSEKRKIEGLQFGASESESIYVPIAPREEFDEAEILVGRQEEIATFNRSISALASESDRDAPRIFLIDGEGGMGKSTLLRRFARACKKFENELYWNYTDWEAAGIASNEGTSRMMRYLASQMKSGCGLEFTNLERICRQIERHDEDGGNSSDRAAEEVVQDSSGRHQIALSRAFMADLALAAKARPLVLLFDTYEVVQGFADTWIREGMIKVLLSDPQLRTRFILVVAGRFGEDQRLVFKDDVRRYSGVGGNLFAKNLERLSPGEIQEYSLERFHRAISLEEAKHVFQSSSGFPLGVGLVLNEVQEGGLKDGNVRAPGSIGELNSVTAQLAKRFLKHVLPKRERLRRVMSLITLRAAEGGQIFDRLHLLKLLWERLRLVRDAAQFDGELQSLKRNYSFFLPNGLIHPEVLRYLQQWALSSEFDPSLTLDVCQEAHRICGTEQESRARKLKEYYGQEYFESRKYRDSAWQNWTLDTLHYGLWLNKVDETVESILDYYVSALVFGFASFADSLLAVCLSNSALNVRLEAHHSKLLHQLQSLKPGLANDQLEVSRVQLREFLQGKTKLAALIQTSKIHARRGNYRTSKMEAAHAEKMAAELQDTIDPSLRRELARALLLLGEGLSGSHVPKGEATAIQLEARDTLERALIWNDTDPNIRCALGDAYLRMDWLDDAKNQFELALGMGAEKRAGAGLRQVSAREAVIGKKSKVSERLAYLCIAQASTFCSEARFDEAARKVDHALKLVPNFLPARIKRCHILRVEGDAAGALQELELIDLASVGSIEWKASILDAKGATCRALDRLPEAEAMYRSALNASPEYMNALYGLGRVYLSSSRHAEALQCFEKVIDIKRRMQDRKGTKGATLYWVYLAMGLARSSTGASVDADNAFMIAEKLSDRDLQQRDGCRHYQLWSTKALALIGQKQYEGARDAISRLLLIPSVSRAKGMHRQFASDVSLLGKLDASDDFKRLAATIELLQ